MLSSSLVSQSAERRASSKVAPIVVASAMVPGMKQTKWSILGERSPLRP